MRNFIFQLCLCLLLTYFFKTIFDCLIIDYNLGSPIALIIIGFLVTKRISDEQLAINDQNNQQEILDKYLESIERLLLNITPHNEGKIYSIIKFKTLTVLRRLSLKLKDNKSIILRFLYDTGLIHGRFYGSNLQYLDLSLCDFEKLNFQKANLPQIHLEKVNLKGVIFQGCNLKGANFQEANLKGVNFQDSDIEGVNFYQASLPNFKQLKLANNWNKAVYTTPLYSIEDKMWVPKNKEQNDAKIEKIKAQI